jgi:hypothetical protein
MGKYTNWSKVTRPAHKLENHDIDEVKEVWEHDHVEDTFAYYGSKYQGSGAVARISEFGVSVHYNEEFETVSAAEDELREVLSNSPYVPGMEVWTHSDYGIHKAIVQKVDKNRSVWDAEIKLLEENPAAGWEVGDTTWIPIKKIDRAEEFDGHKRTQIRENARQNDWLR